MKNTKATLHRLCALVLAICTVFGCIPIVTFTSGAQITDNGYTISIGQSNLLGSSSSTSSDDDSSDGDSTSSDDSTSGGNCTEDDCDGVYENGFCSVCGGYEAATRNSDEVYEIANAGQLYWFADYVNAGNYGISAKLTADITVNSGVLKEDGSLNGDGSNFREWMPIGSSSKNYEGTFDGDGHAISGLYFNDSSRRYVGLFGDLSSGGTVQNVGIVDSYFCGKQQVGGVVGSNAGTIENCYNAGTVISTYDYNTCIGGVVGISTGTIKGCHNTGKVGDGEKCESVGGVVGCITSSNVYTIVENCYNIGTVSGNEQVGGVVGEMKLYAYYGKAKVTNCYNRGKACGYYDVGGVVGSISTTLSNDQYHNSNFRVYAHIISCYSIGEISATHQRSPYAGSIVGRIAELVTANVENNYYLTGSVKTYYDTEHNGIGSGSIWTPTADEEGKTMGMATDAFSSGEVAYLLNNEQDPVVWYQGKDAPAFKGCPVSYENEAYIINHSWEDGVCTGCEAVCSHEQFDGSFKCTVCGYDCPHTETDGNFCTLCGAVTVAPTKDNDGYYILKSVSDLYWFAQQVNSGNTSICAKLGADIVVNPGTFDKDGNYTPGEGEVTGTKPRVWTPIGTTENPYTGTFDGANHTISGLYLDDTTAQYVGLFGQIDGGATIKNVGVTDNYFCGDRYVGGIVAYAFITGDAGDIVIESCYNSGYVKAVLTDNQLVPSAGGVVGRANIFRSSEYNIIIRNCYNGGDVLVTHDEQFQVNYVNIFYVGGVIGCFDDNVTVANCYNTGDITGIADKENIYVYVGGISGKNDGKTENCYNTGKVTGTAQAVTNRIVAHVGGIAGQVSNSDGTVTNCYNTGTVSGTGEYVGGIAGENNGGTVTNCFYLNTSADVGIGEDEGSGEAVAVTEEQLKSGEVAYLLNIGQDTTVWYQTCGEGAPAFSGNTVNYGYRTCADSVALYTNDTVQKDRIPHTMVNGICSVCQGLDVPSGSGTAKDPYIITNVGQLYWFAEQVNGGNTEICGKLGADIKVNDNVLKSDGTPNTGDFRAWTPIGSILNPYRGTFDGNDHTISGLYFNDNTAEYVGLFGCISDSANIKSTTLEQSYICGKDNVGGIIGGTTDGVAGNAIDITIVGNNIKDSVTVIGANCVGGIIGYSYAKTIDRCSAYGKISGSANNVGGIVGVNFKGTIKDCIVKNATVSGTNYVGGIVGSSSGNIESGYVYQVTISGAMYVGGVTGLNAAIITDGKVAEGSVTGTMYVGGVAGRNTGTIKRTHSGSYVTSTDTDVAITGGISGDNSGMVEDCFSQCVLTAQGAGVGGVVGGNTGTIQNCLSMCNSISGSEYIGAIAGKTNGGTIANCYYYASASYIGIGDTTSDTVGSTDKKTELQIGSGEVVWLLNGGVTDGTQAWYQYIEEETERYYYPSLEDAGNNTVYYGYNSCSESAKAFYTNDSSINAEKPSHYGVCTSNGNDTHTTVCTECGEVVGEANVACTFDEDYFCTVCYGEHVHTKGEDGFCTVCGRSVTIPAQDDDGVYLIYTASELYWFAEQVNHKYAPQTEIQAKLMADICVNNGKFDAEGNYTVDGVAATPRVWTPIANGYAYYYASFDGNGKTVSGLYCNQTYGYVGFFAQVSAFEVKDLRIANSYFAGNYAGAIIGYADGTTIENCSAAADVYVKGTNNAGGIVGYNSGTINNCYSLAKVADSGTWGGLAGYNYGSIKNSFTTAMQPVGVNNKSYGGSLTNVFYGEDTRDYTTPDESGYVAIKPTFEGAVEVTDAVFKSGKITWLLNGEKSDGVWKQNLSINNYPTLENSLTVYKMINDGCSLAEDRFSNTEGEHFTVEHSYNDNGFCGCGAYQPAVSNNGVYEISNAGQLYWFAAQVNSGYGDINGKLMNDITVNPGKFDKDGNYTAVNGETARTWTPIGNEFYAYIGTFDGAKNAEENFTVSGLYFNDDTSDYVGLFGHLGLGIGQYGTVKNVTLENSYFKGNTYVGGIAGQNYEGYIINCHNSGVAVYGNEKVGGIVGNNEGVGSDSDKAKIEKCINSGSVSGSAYIGGIVGMNYYASIADCTNSGNVSGVDCVGGIVGYNFSLEYDNKTEVFVDHNASVAGCANSGDIVGEKDDVGGIIGYSRGGKVKNCYNSGTIKATNVDYGSKVGGIVGYKFYGTVENCYSTGDVTGILYVGGVVGCLKDSTVTNCYYLASESYYGIGDMGGGTDGQTEAVTDAQLKSGEIAYKLNGDQSNIVWYQTCGEGYPAFEGKRVYRYTNCSDGYAYTNDSATETGAHDYDDDGFCKFDGTHYQPCETDENGVYLIKNAGNLYWFAQQVNSGYTSINGKLMANITVNPGTFDEDGKYTAKNGETLREWTPIGSGIEDDVEIGTFVYIGTFDGNGHTISGLYFNNSQKNYVGLFGSVGENGTVQKVGVVDSYLLGNFDVGGIAGFNAGRIDYCYNTGTVSGLSDVGGVVGWNQAYESYVGTVKNCYSTGEVTGTGDYVGGIAGKNESTVTNCYYNVAGSGIGGETDASGVVESMANGDFISGKVTYLLNGEKSDENVVWKQTLNGKNYPGFSGDTVYKMTNTGCSSAADRYSNFDGLSFIGEHSFDENGFCACGEYEEPKLVDGYYEIYNAGQLYWFAAKVNGGSTNICGKLMNDIKVNDDVIVDGALNTNELVVAALRTWTPIGPAYRTNPYIGTFDGNGNTISGLYVSESELENIGLFGFIYNGAVVKNVGVVNSYFGVKGYVGSVAGQAYAKDSGSVTIENCYSSGNLCVGSSAVGGVVGYISTKNDCTITVKNCCNAGSVSGNSYVGGIVGYVGNYASGVMSVTNCYNTGFVSCEPNLATEGYIGGIVGEIWHTKQDVPVVENCYNIGKVSCTAITATYVGGVVGQVSKTSGAQAVENCYYLSGCATDGNSAIQFGIGGTTSDAEGQTEAVTDAQLKSGEITWLLNGKTSEGVWKQTLDGTSYPGFVGDTVYCGYYKCDETVRYSNSDELLEAPHSYDKNGFCTQTEGQVHYEPAKLVDGVYQIKNGGNLFRFAQQVNSGKTDINAVLTDNIDLENREWTAIGSESKPYTGTFDGNGKTIENLKITATSSYQGLFGVIGNAKSGGTVKNLTLKGKIDITATINNVGGLAGYAVNGSNIENVYCYVIITDSRTGVTTTTADDRLWNVGGIVASLESSTIKNSAYYGTITLQVAARVGGVIGIASKSDANISYCTNHGSVTSNGYSAHIGGITGDAQSGAYVDHCLNYGKVTSGGDDCIGGIVGYANEYVKIEYCGNIGDVECTNSTGGYIGGILGYVNNANFKLLANCYNYGKITSNSGSKNHPGAIVGWINTSTTVNETIFHDNYYLAGSSTQVSDSKTIPEAYEMTAGQFRSGEVAYKLGGDWKQTIGTDAYPNFSGKTVNYGYELCAETQSYTNAQVYTEITHRFDEKGFCNATEGQTHYQSAVLNDGVYEICNAGQLFWFANYVNSGNAGASAKLMADIDLEGRLWTPIGLYSDDPAITKVRTNTAFTGTFDGNYHIIKNLYVEMTENYEAGLFSRVATGGVIKNLGVINATVKQNQDGHEGKGVRAGIIAGEIYRATVENVFTAGTLVLETQHDQFGGLAGECKESTLKNCYTTIGRLTDGTSGNTPSLVTNCYYLADSANAESAGEYVTESRLKSGEIAYKFNGETSEGTLHWSQICGEGYPVFNDGNIVYRYTDCKGAYHYANAITADGAHDYNDNGFCKLCDAYEPCEIDENGVYLIKNAGNLYWFAQQVNSGYTSINGKLTANIVVNDNVLKSDGTLNDGNFRAWTAIGNNFNSPYYGTFNGNGYTISGLYYSGNDSYVGLFGYVNNGNVQNVTIKDSYFNGDRKGSDQHIGGIVGHLYGGKILCCISYATIAGEGNSEFMAYYSAYVGGIVGRNGGTVRNCGNLGNVSGLYAYVGGVAGWNVGGTVESCYDVGTVGGNYSSIGAIVGANEDVYSLDSGTVTNCYFLKGTATYGIGSGSGGTIVKTSDEFASGEVTWLLNGETSEGTWKQTLETDAYPNFSGEDVYKLTNTGCSHYAAYKYSSANETYAPAHDFGDEGFCARCDAYEPCETDENGVYLIKNAGNLYWFAAKVNGGEHTICAKLGADITVNPGTFDNDGNYTAKAGETVRKWVPIGSISSPYKGKFDGDSHTIKGLYFSNSAKNDNAKYVGLFGNVSEAKIESIGVIDGYFHGYEQIGGVVGYNNGGTVKNCYNTNSISGESFVGGIVGYDMNGTVENCYNRGTVVGEQVGGIVGNGYQSTIKDCYNNASIGVATYQSVGGIIGYNNGSTVENCYNSGNVNGNKDVGGVVGYNVAGTVENCYNNGNVGVYDESNAVGDNFGGVVGTVVGGNVNKCYNTGKIFGSTNIGGVVGYVNDETTITNCYNTGDIMGGAQSNTYTGGVIGYIEVSYNYNVSVKYCYSLGDIVKQIYGASVSAPIGGVVGGIENDGVGTVSIYHCYYLNSSAEKAIFDCPDNVDQNEVGSKTSDEFASGEVTWLLNDKKSDGEWKQTIGKDDYPSFSGMTVYFDNDAYTNKDVEFVGYTLTLDGNIGMNFYTLLSKNFVDKDGYIEFTINGRTVKIKASEARTDGIYHIFTIPVYAYEMNEEINAVAYLDGKQIESDKESIRDYAKYIIDNPDSYTEEDIAFAKALLNYGAAAQKYFEVNDDDLANKDVDTGTVPELEAGDLESYEADAVDNDYGKFYGFNLRLYNMTCLNVYFRPAEGCDISGFTFKVNGEDATIEKDGEYYRLACNNIRAYQLDDTMTFEATYGDVTLTYECSAMSYCYSVLMQDTDDEVYTEDLKALVFALRDYQLKSEIYGG